MKREYLLVLAMVLLSHIQSFAQSSAYDTKSYPKNLVHIDVLAPLAEPGMYGGAYERVFSMTSSFGGPRSFLVGFAMADEIEINGLTIDDFKATDLVEVGILVREYASDSLSGVYSQYGISYITGDASGTTYDSRDQPLYQEYDLNA